MQNSLLVIGGPPTSSYDASCLTREGIDIVVEAAKFPGPSFHFPNVDCNDFQLSLRLRGRHP